MFSIDVMFNVKQRYLRRMNTHATAPDQWGSVFLIHAVGFKSKTEYWVTLILEFVSLAG